jgi:hypothetical protein
MIRDSSVARTLFVVVGCATIGCAHGQTGTASDGLLTGNWGGEHIALALTGTGGTLEYDCAHGGITEPVRSIGGRIEAAGVHVREHGGPVREGERPDSLPARYLGTVRGDALTLRVVVGADTLGPFELQRGTEPRLLKCL